VWVLRGKMFAELPLNVKKCKRCAKSGLIQNWLFADGKFGKRFFLKKFKLRLLVFGKLRLLISALCVLSCSFGSELESFG